MEKVRRSETPASASRATRRLESSPPGEQDAHRYVRHLVVPAHGLAQGVMDLLQPGAVAEGLFGARCRQPPIGALGPPPVLIDAQPMAGGQLAQTPQQGAWGGDHRVQGEQVVEGDRVDLGVDPAGPEQGLGGGREAEGVPLVRPVQGFDPESVTGQEERPPGPIPEGEGEHAVQVADGVLAPGVPGLEDGLAIAVGEEPIAHAPEFPAQLAIVVDGAVEHQGEPQLRIHEGLIGAQRQVDDGQAPVPHPQGAVAVASTMVGTTPPQVHHHGRDGAEVRRGAVEAQFTANAAHVMV